MLAQQLRPGVHHYTLLAYAYALHGDAGGCLGVVNRALAAGLAPSVLLFNHALRGAALAGAAVASGGGGWSAYAVAALLLRLTAAGASHITSGGNARHFATCRRMSCLRLWINERSLVRLRPFPSGDLDIATIIFRRMLAAGVAPDVATFTRLFSAAWAAAEAARLRTQRRLATTPTFARYAMSVGSAGEEEFLLSFSFAG